LATLYMPSTRPRRIVRRAAMVLVVVVLLCTGWLMLGESPEIQRSRAIRLGIGSRPPTSSRADGGFGVGR